MPIIRWRYYRNVDRDTAIPAVLKFMSNESIPVSGYSFPHRNRQGKDLCWISRPSSKIHECISPLRRDGFLLRLTNPFVKCLLISPSIFPTVPTRHNKSLLGARATLKALSFLRLFPTQKRTRTYNTN